VDTQGRRFRIGDNLGRVSMDKWAVGVMLRSSITLCYGTERKWGEE